MSIEAPMTQKVKCAGCGKIEDVDSDILIEGYSTVCLCGHITDYSQDGGVMSEAPKGAIYVTKPTYTIRMDIFLERSGNGWDADEKVLPCEKRSVCVEIPKDQLDNIAAWINAAGQTLATSLNSMAHAEHDRFAKRTGIIEKPQ